MSAILVSLTRRPAQVGITLTSGGDDNEKGW